MPYTPVLQPHILTGILDVTQAISTLKLDTSPTSTTKSALKPKNKKIADSWDEDSDTETESSTPNTTSAPLSTITSETATPPGPPPPTPASPTGPFEYPDIAGGAGFPVGEVARERAGSGTASPARRPEKTTAVAGRLIAGALGVRAPRRTEEEREYDRVMREKERKRRDEERERVKREEAERERRKKAIWDD